MPNPILNCTLARRFFAGLTSLVLLGSLVGPSVHAARGSHVSGSIATVFDDGEGRQIPYHLFLPPGHDDPDRKFPLVLFLHGAGERGTDNILQASTNIPGLIVALRSTRFASYLLTP